MLAALPAIAAREEQVVDHGASYIPLPAPDPPLRHDGQAEPRGDRSGEEPRTRTRRQFACDPSPTRFDAARENPIPWNSL